MTRTLPGSMGLLAVLLLSACAGQDAPGSSGPASPASTVEATGPGEPSVAAAGRVLDSAGRPVAGALVAVAGPAAAPDLAVVTDAEGRYAWPAVLAPGTWRLQAATPDGQAVAVVHLVVGQGAAVADLRVPPR